jgi:uncharacterized membrane protein (UPF0127 family)
MPTLRNLTTGRVVARNVVRSEGFFERMIGFLSRSSVDPDDGLWFDRCAAIHTVGMRARIDVIFLNSAYRVIRIDRSVPQFRLAVACPGAHAVVELGEAPADGRDLLAGDELALE